MITKNENRTLNAQEVAEELGVCKKTIYKMVKEKKIPFYRIGRLIRFTSDAIEEYQRIQEQEVLSHIKKEVQEVTA
ncbi:helix-turn-helix domain-containing protein [Bacillus altitudinis]|uniref:helix-turn-helix domain-containing protein n=1 Tax=Bacillus altitudinis TaxID=293387 RepID=UPI001B332EDD|nr:helix-turn-helix domain-containing protein [Bacillus altitudinis]QTV11396.1 helix-turn-helix domain-containing protein [Bacillus altitudinis]